MNGSAASRSAATRDAAGGGGQIGILRALAESYGPEKSIESVAVVGNAPLAPSDERARVIDESDIVFRVNGFREDGLRGPRIVGRKTNVVVFNRGVRATPWLFHQYRERLYLMVEPGRMHWERAEHPSWWPHDLGHLSVSNRDIVLPLAEELGLNALRDAVWATTGTTMAWLARVMFPHAALHMTGFSFISTPDQKSWDHAYGSASPVGSEHVISREGALLSTWASEGSAILHD